MTYTPYELMERWREVFRAANHREPPSITYYNGWFTIAGSYKWRRRDVGKQIVSLAARAAKGE